MNTVTLWYHPLLEALGYTVFHALWQSVLLFFPLQGLLFFTKKSKQRYRIQFSAFTLLFVAFVTTFIIEWKDAISIQHAGIAITQWMHTDYWAANIPHATSVQTSWWQRLSHIIHDPVLIKMMPFISIGYVLGLLFFAFRMAFSLRILKALRHQTFPVSELLQQKFDGWLQALKIKQKVALVFSEKVNVPMMMGYLKPIVILPFALVNQLDMEQTEAILIHELSHVKRKDYLFNMLQSVMEVFMFFNPMVWWLSAAIRKEREHCCDDEVLNQTAAPVIYAAALYQLELTRSNLQPALAASGNNNKYTLLTRIKRIIDMKTTQNRRPQGMLLAIITVLIFAATCCFYTAIGQEKKEDKKTEPSANKPTSKQTSKTITVITKDKEENGEDVVPDIQATVKQALNAANVAMDNINWDDVQQAVKEAKVQMSQIDTEEFKRDMEEAKADMAAAKIDMDEASREMKAVDFSKVDESVKLALNSLQEIDWDEIGNSINGALKSADVVSKNTLDSAMQQVRVAMKNAKIEMRKARIQSDNNSNTVRIARKKEYKEISEDRQEALAVARANRDKALATANQQRLAALANADKQRTEALKNGERQRTEALANADRLRAEALKNAAQIRAMAISNGKIIADSHESDDKVTKLLNRLEKEGRINRNEKYKVSYKNQVMKVNGLIVPASDYQQYLPKGKDASLSVSGKKGSLSVSVTE